MSPLQVALARLLWACLELVLAVMVLLVVIAWVAR